jgi:uncharacterized protein
VTEIPAPTWPHRRRRLKVYGSLLAIIIVSWFVFDIPGLAESRLVYFPTRDAFVTPSSHEDVQFQSPDGLRLRGWLIMPPGWSAGDPPVPAVLHIHGNAGNISYHEDFSSFLPPAGYAVLLFDYRGFGRSDSPRGRLNRRFLLSDARSALDYLQTRPEVDRDRIAVYGVSLGGVLGVALAAERQDIRGVVSLAAFSSWSRIARDHFGWIGWLLARPGIDAERSIAKLAGRPVLLVHGQADDIVRADHARRLKAAADVAGVSADLVIVPEAGHNDLAIGDSATQARIVEFLGRCLAPAPG